MGLTPKQQRFVSEYLKDLNATQAAIRTGYSEKSAGSQAHELLKKPEISAAIAEKQGKQLESAGLSASRVLEELRRLAFSDLRGLVDEQGNLKPLHKLTDEEAAAVSSVEVIIKNAKAGDNQTDTIHKIRMWDKGKALEALAKHFALFDERVQHSGKIEVVWASPE